ncbi:hypothetical protein NF700_00865 [Sphingomonadaceae bacterium OTU29MARTA1]|nr:hypothetical protein NF700_00865 [Sphingomonadaceae bacterium OTU29MARTA1]
MEIPNGFLIGLLLFGILVAALLWGFGMVPWWGALLCLIVVPIVVCAALILLFYALWMASGSH